MVEVYKLFCSAIFAYLLTDAVRFNVQPSDSDSETPPPKPIHKSIFEKNTPSAPIRPLKRRIPLPIETKDQSNPPDNDLYETLYKEIDDQLKTVMANEKAKNPEKNPLQSQIRDLSNILGSKNSDKDRINNDEEVIDNLIREMENLQSFIGASFKNLESKFLHEIEHQIKISTEKSRKKPTVRGAIHKAKKTIVNNLPGSTTTHKKKDDQSPLLSEDSKPEGKSSKTTNQLEKEEKKVPNDNNHQLNEVDDEKYSDALDTELNVQSDSVNGNENNRSKKNGVVNSREATKKIKEGAANIRNTVKTSIENLKNTLKDEFDEQLNDDNKKKLLTDHLNDNHTSTKELLCLQAAIEATFKEFEETLLNEIDQKLRKLIKKNLGKDKKIHSYGKYCSKRKKLDNELNTKNNLQKSSPKKEEM